MTYNPNCNITEHVIPANPGENTTIYNNMFPRTVTVVINGTEYPT